MKFKSVSTALETGMVGLGGLGTRVQKDNEPRFPSFWVNFQDSAGARAGLVESLANDQAHR